MTRLSDLMGQPTISLDDAERGGSVEGVELASGRVTGLRTRASLIDVASIRTFEGDAVTYDGAPQPVQGDNVSPLGHRVLTVDGEELGRLVDLDIAEDGTITSILLDNGGGLDGGALQVVGSYAVIVDSAPITSPSASTTLPPPELPPETA